MLNPKLLRNEIETIKERLATRGYFLDLDRFTSLEQERKHWYAQVERGQQERNTLSRTIAEAKKAGQEFAHLQKEVVALKQELETADRALLAVEAALQTYALDIPNLPSLDVPIGKSEDENVVIKTVGSAKRSTGLDHIALSASWLCSEQAAFLSGSRFSVLKGPLARLHRALIEYMLAYHRERGYVEHYVPYLVKAEALIGTGQLPKFEQDLFKVQSDPSLYLIPTAEVPLTNLFAQSITSVDELPLKVMAHTPCFRLEAGAYGKETRGLFRQHQFEKVELVQLVDPKTTEEALLSMVQQVSDLLTSLDLPHRWVNLCTSDLGFAAEKTIDLEVWLPGQQCYREISSCSSCGSFQAQRMKARYRDQSGIHLLHTLNGSGVAVGRALIALIENHGHPDGCAIPIALQPFLEGKSFFAYKAA